MPDQRNRDAAVDERLSYEQARTELAAVVERLADICQRWLDGARERIDAARQSRAEG